MITKEMRVVVMLQPTEVRRRNGHPAYNLAAPNGQACNGTLFPTEDAAKASIAAALASGVRNNYYICKPEFAVELPPLDVELKPLED